MEVHGLNLRQIENLEEMQKWENWKKKENVKYLLYIIFFYTNLTLWIYNLFLYIGRIIKINIGLIAFLFILYN